MIWLTFGRTIKEFITLGRFNPGTLIEVLVRDRKKQFLIGDLNQCCSKSGKKIFADETIVLRYKIIWAR